MHRRKNGYLATVTGLKGPVSDWKVRCDVLSPSSRLVPVILFDAVHDNSYVWSPLCVILTPTRHVVGPSRTPIILYL